MSEPRTIVVTGGASGIGRSVAHRFHGAGWRVAVVDLGGGDRSADVDRHDVDVSDPDAVQAAFREIGTVDALVNCAGVREIAWPLELSSAEWSRVLAVNLSGTFYCSQAAALRMPRGGSIVNVASVTALRGFARRAAYSASKAGVLGLTRSLSQDLAGLGIRVNAVCPGLVDTPLTHAYVGTDAAQAGLALTVPMGRAGSAEEVAAVVAFLVSDAAAYVTGVAIPVDGGFTAMGTFDPEKDLRRPPAGSPR